MSFLYNKAAAAAASLHTTAENAKNNRYDSFAPESTGDAKFHVGGCSYFWAVSEALEKAKEEIWILGWFISPEVFLRRPPSENAQYRFDRMLKAAAERGVKVNVIAFKEVPVMMSLSSKHAKNSLEALHPNISVFRHPDGYQGAQSTLSTGKTMLQGLMAAGKSGITKLSDETLQTMIAAAGGPTLLWAHHEKVVIVDREVAFLGGIDLSYGRWDTIQHPIADAHPGNLDDIVFPGQDYNNARVKDFHNLENWEHNKLSRLSTARMGWQDISLSFTGPAVADLSRHFIERWNFIHGKKYSTAMIKAVKGKDGASHENSIYTAYMDIITNSEHFVYLEQQFFVTSTGSWLGTVWNRVGEVLVNRILRAASEQKRFKVIVIMPSVPAFAGDLQSVISGHPPRAIMKLQYKSICRGGFSIMDKITKAGVVPEDYIRFYNLQTFDRINESNVMDKTELASGVDYQAASVEHDDIVDPFGVKEQKDAGDFEGDEITKGHQAYQKYQKESHGESSKWDTVSSCYMHGGPDIRTIPWARGGKTSEIDAFVTEQLYVHSKVLIADDKIVLCGSANLNDRSLRGSRDSEIALVVEDPTPIQSTMNGVPFQASRFATSLRRYLFRKHMGLLQPQDMRKPDSYFHPAPSPSDYDFGSAEDKIVADPLSDPFLKLWSDTAAQNTLSFRKVFAVMPDDTAKTWIQYQALFLKRYMGPEGLQWAKWGHVAKSNFPAGEEGVKLVKEELSRIKGMVIEMPLQFLAWTDVQVEDPGYNIITRQGYC
ncbi:phospholipase D/nuclease [Cadophora sp. DSE1049]|nr:phospholipase D/nuclease [Cadophora sp. DSE1049]